MRESAVTRAGTVELSAETTFVRAAPLMVRDSLGERVKTSGASGARVRVIRE